MEVIHDLIPYELGGKVDLALECTRTGGQVKV
jgi:hypothetical protein